MHLYIKRIFGAVFVIALNSGAIFCQSGPVLPPNSPNAYARILEALAQRAPADMSQVREDHENRMQESCRQGEREAEELSRHLDRLACEENSVSWSVGVAYFLSGSGQSLVNLLWLITLELPSAEATPLNPGALSTLSEWAQNPGRRWASLGIRSTLLYFTCFSSTWTRLRGGYSAVFPEGGGRPNLDFSRMNSSLARARSTILDANTLADASRRMGSFRAARVSILDAFRSWTQAVEPGDYGFRCPGQAISNREIENAETLSFGPNPTRGYGARVEAVDEALFRQLPRLPSRLLPADPLLSGAGCPTCHQPGAERVITQEMVTDSFSSNEAFRYLFELETRFSASRAPALTSGVPQWLVTIGLVGGAIALRQPRIAQQAARFAPSFLQRGLTTIPGLSALLDTDPPSAPPGFLTHLEEGSVGLANGFLNLVHSGRFQTTSTGDNRTVLSRQSCQMIRAAVERTYDQHCLDSAGRPSIAGCTGLEGTIGALQPPVERRAFVETALQIFECSP